MTNLFWFATFGQATKFLFNSSEASVFYWVSASDYKIQFVFFFFFGTLPVRASSGFVFLLNVRLRLVVKSPKIEAGEGLRDGHPPRIDNISLVFQTSFLQRACFFFFFPPFLDFIAYVWEHISNAWDMKIQNCVNRLFYEFTWQCALISPPYLQCV